MINRFFPICVVLTVLCAATLHAQIKAFPQAEGFGAIALGGRGGDVYHVNKLTDDGSTGTLRHGIESASGPRTIVFDVAGWIDLTSKLGIANTKSKITIAGQTAPGDGIGVRGNQFSVGGDDIVVRHMRFRPGKGAGRVDSAGANVDAERVIYDHISAGYSHDENFSTQATDLTLQFSTVSYGLEDHSAGSLIEGARRLSFHHNLYAHNNTRNPKARVNETLDWVNNVVYDYNNGFIAGDSDTTDFFWTANIDGNYYITGPGDTGRPMVRDGRAWNYGLYFGTNAYDNDGDTAHDGALYTGNGVDATGLSGVVSGAYTWRATPYPTPTLWKDATPQAAYERVLSEFGPTPWNRDEIDTLLYNNVVNRTGAIVSHENQLGLTNGGFGTLASGSQLPDTDGDGIPNAWEVKHGTNPAAASNNGDFDYDGYTDLEEYLNDLAAFPAIGALEFSGIGRYADWRRWTNKWEPSRVDDVRVSSGAAFVDAVGQKAGDLTIAGNARFYVTSGWLEVTDDFTIDGAGQPRVEQHGGQVRLLIGDVNLTQGSYLLQGGELDAAQVHKSAGGTLSLRGGTLSTSAIDFSVTNQGSTLRVGRAGIGQTTVTGDLTIQAGALAFELGSPVTADALTVTGAATLGGALNITRINGYVPAINQTWTILSAGSITGTFSSVTSGYVVEQIGNQLQLRVVNPAAVLAVPEPSALVLLIGSLLIFVGKTVGCHWRAASGTKSKACSTSHWRHASGTRAMLGVLMLMATATPVSALTLFTTADAELRENGTTGIGDALDSGVGTGVNLNARWINTGTTPNRNEWIALKFDLSAYPDKTRFENVALRTIMYRANLNNTKTLRLYALTPGVANENWNEATITYGTMPGFTFDANSNTNILNVGGALQSLGTFGVSGVEGEGNLSNINPASITNLIRGMGANNLLTLLISYDVSSTGQWRIASREATATETNVLTGVAGAFAARLDFTLTSSAVRGDYNDDGQVSAADYTTYRDRVGGTNLLNEEVSPGVIDIADYLYWRERFNATNTGAPAASAAVPEPMAIVLLIGGMILCRVRCSASAIAP